MYGNSMNKSDDLIKRMIVKTKDIRGGSLSPDERWYSGQQVKNGKGHGEGARNHEAG